MYHISVGSASNFKIVRQININMFKSACKLLRHLNCMSKKIKVLLGGRPARPEYTI